MADQTRILCTARHDPMTADERLVVSIIALLALQWSFSDARKALLALAQPHAAKLRKDADFDLLHAAFVKMTASTSPIDWTYAQQSAQAALPAILRRDLNAALRDIPTGA